MKFKENDRVVIKSVTIDSLQEYFGDEGDGDFWFRDEWDIQIQYEGHCGTVIQTEKTKGYGTFLVIEFDNGQCFTFHEYDVDFV